jgi:hypothetical protein
MGSVSAPAGPISDELDVLLVHARRSRVPIIDVAVEADRLCAALADSHLSREEIAHAIFERCTHIGGVGVVMRTPPLEAGKET